MARPPVSTAARRISMVQRWVRKQFIVNPRYQYRTILPVVVCVGVFVILAGATVFFPISRGIEGESDPGIQVLLQEQYLQFHARLWISLFVAGALAALYALMRSHKVAGPLFRLNQVMTDIASGKDVKEVRFRDGDEFREFEGLATKVGKRVRTLSTLGRDVEKVLVDLESHIEELRTQCRGAEQYDRQAALMAFESLLDDLYKHTQEAKKHRWGFQKKGVK